jgi:hypothetical protein
MIENMPAFVSLLFGIVTIATLLLFYWTLKNSDSEITRRKANPIAAGLILWLILQAFLTIKGFYNSNLDAIPPKLMLFGILPMILLIVLLFVTTKGKQFIDSLPLASLTYLNVIRIPVEITLLYLFLNKAVPQLMTFEGRNFDILSGISAPLIAYFGFVKKTISLRVILIWNFICLALLANIVIIALLSAPFLFEQFAFEQPNIAILNFPFSWLPTFIVPVVLFGHLVSIRKLTRSKN